MQFIHETYYFIIVFPNGSDFVNVDVYDRMLIH